ncbi:hypothetical protein JAAARDRAFT_152238 [Jaapia argillacea MUCL 33604]|uniref:RNA-dependent RNA polymerase n=1 Tax=Jaapia argillacea MUCL 33604 TaxID=933084 RepID=A0A067Q4Q5_9AGAM|nr:hypothetical protein JAAARDRAFT_152238 [Jaapia argillacea MUCL 33604]
MELDIKGLDFYATKFDVKMAIASVLHGELRLGDSDDRLCNFEVSLNPGLSLIRNDGSGKLTLPNDKVWRKLKEWMYAQGNSIKVLDRAIRLYPTRNKVKHGLKQVLQKAHYMDPALEKEHDEKVQQLDAEFRVVKVQIGIYFRSSYGPRSGGRSFSSEWEAKYDATQKSVAWLRFYYDHKSIRIKLGEPMTDETCQWIVIKFSAIQLMAVGHDFGRPYICFDTVVPPTFEREYFNRTTTGDFHKDGRKFRERVGFLNPSHQRVAPYVHQVRVELSSNEDIDHFYNLCVIAGLRHPIRGCTVDALSHGFYSEKNLTYIQRWLCSLEFKVAFQLAALFHNSLLTSDEVLRNLLEPINDLCISLGDAASHILRQFSEALRTRPQDESPKGCFERVRVRTNKPMPPVPSGMFMCHHVSFTPTRILLEGPYVIQSNRIIREYAGYEENFIRVDFRDEDRLQYRWERETDGTYFLQERVGGVLKNRFSLAGRDFEFLAYSSSALREHSVWFMRRFMYTDAEHGERWITAETIRNSLGNFRGTELIKFPSKYAARMAQAFTATDSSVKIRREDWEVVNDLGVAPYEFTDGCGTISPALGDQIWETLCKTRGYGVRTTKPSAYQIRFLGFKGVVTVDHTLTGIHMRLRPSMRKFAVHLEREIVAEIEIAQAFDKPMSVFLNRSLIMVLEDRGVAKEKFMKLQEIAIADVKTASDSISQLRKLLDANGLGSAYRLSWVMQGLKDLGFDLSVRAKDSPLHTNFLKRAMRFAINHVLRDIKHGARIPIPKSYLLPGVADEGPAYEAAGHENVFKLKEGQIYACIQQPGETSPTWIKGRCIIWRSPVVHPGDVVHVSAVGQPPEDKMCFFKNLVNVVVLPSEGKRSLASCLAGGDVDGDLFCISQEQTMLPTFHHEPAEYKPVDTRKLEDDRDSTIEDICDFVVEYINSDVLGLLSDRHLIIADQSKHGTEDELCIQLAELCSRAVDYPKNGVPVPIDDIPRFLIPYKPDWHAAEVTSPRSSDYYESSRALGHLYREITLLDPTEPSPGLVEPIVQEESFKAITDALEPLILAQLGDLAEHHISKQVEDCFSKYEDEMRYISVTHTLSSSPGVCLTEEEVVVSTILAKCSQKRWRKDRMHRLQVHASNLVQQTRRELFPDSEEFSPGGLQRSLQRAWEAWSLSVQKCLQFNPTAGTFTAHNSFGLVSLGVLFEILDSLAGSWRTGARPSPQMNPIPRSSEKKPNARSPAVLRIVAEPKQTKKQKTRSRANA